MFVKEIFSGLHPDNKPKASTFDNKYKLLGISLENEFSADQIALHNSLVQLKGIPVGYTYSIDGGTYEDTVVLKDAKLPRSRKGLRVGLAQDLKHQELIDLQYANKK
jgi:GTP cyclohydrolase I